MELNNSARQMTRLNKEKRFRAQSGTYNSNIVRSPFELAEAECNERKNTNRSLFMKNPLW